MKQLLIMMFFVVPLSANDANPVPAVPGLDISVNVGGFEDDIASVSAKLRDEIKKNRIKSVAAKVSEAINKHDPDSAQKALDQILNELPELVSRESAGVWRYQGLIHLWKNNFDEAYGDFDRIVKLIEKVYPGGIQTSSDNFSEVVFISNAYFNRGSTALQKNLYAAAVKDIDIAISLRPAFFMYHEKTQALIGLKKYKEAAEAYDLAYKMNNQVVESPDSTYICGELAKNGISSKACSVKKL